MGAKKCSVVLVVVDDILMTVPFIIALKSDAGYVLVYSCHDPFTPLNY